MWRPVASFVVRLSRRLSADAATTYIPTVGELLLRSLYLGRDELVAFAVDVDDFY